MPPVISSERCGYPPFSADALERVKGMFLEMPGTEWTVAEAARLAGLDTEVCRAILEALQQTGFVSQRTSGAFVRCMLPTPRHSDTNATFTAEAPPL
jgi:hypothetical protein